MKILFVFGGALTASQESIINNELKFGNEVDCVSVCPVETDADLIVSGPGVRMPKSLAATPISEFKPSKKEKKSSKSE